LIVVMNRLAAIVVALTTLSSGAASAAITQTVSAERLVPAPAEAAHALLRSPDRWVATFGEADEVSFRSRGGGRRSVRIHSDSVGHAHTLDVADDGEGMAFTFVDDDHDVGLRGRFTVEALKGGCARVTLTVTVTREGLLTLVPDRLVQARLGAFLEELLDDMAVALSAREPLVAVR
jgi:hypothetical protein